MHIAIGDNNDCLSARSACRCPQAPADAIEAHLSALEPFPVLNPNAFVNRANLLPAIALCVDDALTMGARHHPEDALCLSSRVPAVKRYVVFDQVCQLCLAHWRYWEPPPEPAILNKARQTHICICERRWLPFRDTRRMVMQYKPVGNVDRAFDRNDKHP